MQSINSPAADTGKQEPAADHCAAAANAFHAGNNCLHCLSAAFPCHSQRRQIVLQASYPPIDKAGFFHRSHSQRTSREGGFAPPPQLHAHSARVFPVSERQFPHRSGVLLLNLLLPRFRFFKLGRKISDCGREPLHGGLRFQPCVLECLIGGAGPEAFQGGNSFLQISEGPYRPCSGIPPAS